MKEELNNLLIGPLSKKEMYHVCGVLDAKGVNKSTRTDLDSITGQGYAVKISNNYTVGLFQSYSKYIKAKNKLYRDLEIMSFSTFLKLHDKDISTVARLIVSDWAVPTITGSEDVVVESISNAQEVLENIIPESINVKAPQDPTTKTLTINELQVKNAYRATSDVKLKILLETLFGKEIFMERVYKVGNKFTYNGRNFVIIKTNQTIISMINTEDWENFCMSKNVSDPYNITETELRCLLGVYFDKFIPVL